jgi:hypothetical protein
MRYLVFIGCIFIHFFAFCDTLQLTPLAPKQYIVKDTDTLLKLSQLYLVKPWQWQHIWRSGHPSIKAGDILTLHQNKGSKPYLTLSHPDIIKLSPNMDVTPYPKIITTISLYDIKPFLNESQMLDADFLAKAPYVVGFTGEHLLASQGDSVYVNHLHPTPSMPVGTTQSYAIFRPGKVYKHLDEKNCTHILGFQANLVAYADLIRLGNPATIQITDIKDAVNINDKVLLNQFPSFDLSFDPKEPSPKLRGRILDLLDDYTQGAEGLVAVIDLGLSNGVENGDVFAVYQKRRIVIDPKHAKQHVPLPRERMGEMMIFRAFSHTSYGLVIRSTGNIHPLDEVNAP